MNNNELTATVATFTVAIICAFIWAMTYTLTKWWLDMFDRLEQRKTYGSKRDDNG